MKKRLRKIMAAFLAAAMVASAVPAVSLPAEAASAEGNTELSRQVAADGMVLMENDGALPLAQGETVAMFGRAMIDYVRGGGGSGNTNVDYETNILEGMQEKEDEGKIKLYQPLVDFYTTEVTTNGKTNDANITVTDDMINAAAEEAATAIVTIGRYSGEGSDRTATAGDYYLSEAEQELITRVAQAFEKTVVVLNVGAVLDTEWIHDIEGINSVLMAWQAGQEGGLATADILVGDVNPSGKFVDTFAKSYDDYPSSETFKEATGYVNYTEDIFVGYRYFETFDPNYERLNYEFGYGLSYTTFDTTDVNVSVDGEDIVVTAKVTNTGDVAGKQVVQVYFSAPQGELGKPGKELAAFAKTKLLEPGESEVLTMSYAISDMSSYDDTGKVQKSAYVMEAGDYNIYVGNSIKDAGERGIRYTYTVGDLTVTEQLTQQAAPVQLRERLTADGTYEELPYAPGYDPHYTISATEPSVVECENFIDSSGDLSTESFYGENFEQKRCLAKLNAVGKYAEYELTVEEAGIYAVSMCMANGNAAISNCFKVYVDGKIQPGIIFNAPQTGEGSAAGEWYNFEECEPFYVELPAGTVTFRIEANRNNPNYDYMTFTKSETTLDYYTTVTPTGRTRIEAEKFGASGGTNNNGVRVEEFTRDGQDAACLAYMNYAGNYVSYWLDVEEAGDYNLYFNVANGRAAFSFAPGIEIDDEPVNVSAIQVPQTGDGSGAKEWYNFQDLDPVTVTLPQGKCILTLRAPEGSYPNIDYFELEKQSGSGTNAALLTARSSRAAGTEPEKIMLLDVYNNAELMDDFLAQISDEQLIAMLGGQPNTGVANTGGMGNLMEFGIPNAMTADGPQGIRIGVTCTAWPISTLLACTWDLALVEQVGEAAAVEAHNNGIDIWLAPGMNIHRDPLCGRNFEYYSEDPYLTGKMAAALTRGCQSQGVSITLKHFAANNKEENRNSSDSRMSERALREIYLKGFEIAVKEANPWSIMTSYNYINGTETSENKDLLTNIARGEWGFEGIFMTDWGNNSNHAVELLAGNDVKMSTGRPAVLSAALESGLITRADMEASVERLLNMIMKVNIFQEKVVNPVTVDIDWDTLFKAAENILWSQTARGESTSDEGGGMDLGYCNGGAWTQYQINVKNTGFYLLSARIASNAGSGAFNVVVDGEVLTDFAAVNTGGWQNWTTLDAKQVHLTAGVHTLRLEFTQSGLNLNWLKFAKDESIVDITEKPELTLGKPEFGDRVSDADASAAGTGLPYTVETTWTADGASAGVKFEADIAYTATVKLTAAEGYVFTEDALPTQITVDGQQIDLSDSEVSTNVTMTEVTITHTFDKTEKDMGVYTSKKTFLSIICSAYADVDVSVYTEDSAKALTDALASANVVRKNEAATEEEIEQAAVEVLAAAAGLVFDTSSLQSGIDEAQATANQAAAAATAAQAAADVAKADAAAAQEAADEAKADAAAAQAKAEKAESDAAAAQTAADQAKIDAAEAQKTADEAAQAAAKAQQELDAAKQDITTSEAKIAELETAAAAAQAKAEKAESDAAAAQSAANQAAADAAAAQAKAEKAESDAAAAQEKAEQAESDAAAAQTTAVKAESDAAAAQKKASEAQEEAEAAKNQAVAEAKRPMLTIIINAYKELDLTSYTEASASMLTTAIAEAEAVLEKEDAAEAEIEAAASNILVAAAGLTLDTAADEAAQKEELEKLAAAAEEARKLAEAAQKAAEETKAALEKVQQTSGTQQPSDTQQPGTNIQIVAGQTYDSGDYSYKVTDAEKLTAEVVGIKNDKLTKITVYNSVTLGGKSYKVTSVGEAAFKGNKKVTSAVIGKNVEVIGKNAFAGCTKLAKVTVKGTKLREIGSKAFFGCKKLKNITIKSKVLKKVGKNAFKGIHKKAVIKVPAAKYKAYVKLLAKKGQGSTVRIK